MKTSVGSIAISESLFLNMFTATMEPQSRPSLSHSHPFVEISLVLKGTGTYMADSEDYPIAAGDLFFFGSNSIHYITNVTSSMEMLTLHFPTALLKHIYTATANVNLFASPISMHIRNSDAKQFQLLMQEIQRNLTERPVDYVAYIYSLVTILCINLLRSAIERNIHLDPDKNNASILAALSYIDENISRRITLQEAAAAAMLSPSYFSTLFKRYMGYSLIDYTNAKRIKLATKILLDKPNSSISEIAMQVGFNNMSNFNRAFRKYAGCTPREYITNNSTQNQ